MRNSEKLTNPAWAAALLDACYRMGVRHCCIAPGSRSAVLALAAAALNERSREFELHTHFDERGLAFMALGLARACGAPVVVITTSGTAVANLYPAVIEAYETGIPLWVISADRPDHLLNCGANQAIQQKQLFGGNVLFQQNLTLPTTSAQLQQQMQTFVEGACFDGPLHLNCQFDEPLYGAPPEAYQPPWQDPVSVPITTRPCAADTWLNGFDEQASTVVVLGSLTPVQAETLEPWLRELQCPVLADINSQFRLGSLPGLIANADLLFNCSAYKNGIQAQQVLQIGGRIVSKRVNQWLAARRGHYVLLSEQDRPLDPSRRARQYCVNFSDFTAAPRWQHPDSQTLQQHSATLARATATLLASQWSEAAVAVQLGELLEPRTAVFVGNSLSIRMLDSYSGTTPSRVSVYSNRGASGIDGLIASSAGLAWGACDSVVALLGDTAFLHDLNSLALLRHLPKPVKILLLNNNGGQIFGMLPAAQTSVFEKLFSMPHELQFQSVCDQFGLAYHSVQTRVQLGALLPVWLADKQASVMECYLPQTAPVLINNLITLENCL